MATVVGLLPVLSHHRKISSNRTLPFLASDGPGTLIQRERERGGGGQKRGRSRRCPPSSRLATATALLAGETTDGSVRGRKRKGGNKKRREVRRKTRYGLTYWSYNFFFTNLMPCRIKTTSTCVTQNKTIVIPVFYG